jgi:hypothetical protein
MFIFPSLLCWLRRKALARCKYANNNCRENIEDYCPFDNLLEAYSRERSEEEPQDGDFNET